jgi:hypothetical protein
MNLLNFTTTLPDEKNCKRKRGKIRNKRVIIRQGCVVIL